MAGASTTKSEFLAKRFDAFGDKPIVQIKALRLRVKNELMPYAKHEK
jgi:hypothetical protein